MKVLITGAAGYIGRQLSRSLAGEHDLLLGEVTPIDDARFVPLDVTEPRQVQTAMDSVDAVVHLAIASGREGDVEDDEFNQRRFDVNVRGTFNVLEAARRAGVRRFVFTSSLMVVWGYRPPQRVAADAPPRPVGSYAITKLLGEVLCERYARENGLSIVCLRIPKPVDLDDPAWKERTLRPQWIAFPDLCEAYRLALTAPEIDFQIVTVVAESRRRRWDISKAQDLFGWRPRCDLEQMGYHIGDETAPLTVD